MDDENGREPDTSQAAPVPGEQKSTAAEELPQVTQSPTIEPSNARQAEAGDLASAVAQFQDETYPIDLANALALAGANSLEIRLARERVVEAQAELDQARLAWLPSLRAGLGYNKHDGRLQATEGEVIEAGRNSLFVGGGAGLGDHPLNGGAGGPARLVVDFSLADAAFEPLAARQLVQSEGAARRAGTNDTLLAVAVAYFDLVEAHGLLANALAGLDAADEMVELTSLFAREGRGSQSDADRATVEQAFRRQAALDARRQVGAASAELARLLRLRPQLTLVPVDERVTPVELVDSAAPLEALVAQGLLRRPDLAQRQALVRAALEQAEQERWRPWLPNVAVGASGGSFGGGTSATFDDQGSRSDLDLVATWEMRNLGLGNGALRRERGSQVRQARLETSLVRDRVLAEIVTAVSDVASYDEQIAIALGGIAAADKSYRSNLARIRAGEGLPIELLQANQARIEALDAYTRAVMDFNRSQARLLRALGEPPSVGARNGGNG